jgi:sulfate adenylyltransferase large subunit
MVTGASTADVAVIIVDARNGVVEQSRRHAVIATLLGTKHIVVCINKMDMVGFSEDTFNLIKQDLQLLLEDLGIESHHFIPISALDGDNVVESSERMSWYFDGPLLPHLENITIADDSETKPFRFPVQLVIRPLTKENHDYRGYAGMIATGSIEVGQQITVMPSGAVTNIQAIETVNGSVPRASGGQSVTIRITDNLDVSRGAMFASDSDRPTVDNKFEATVCWMSDRTKVTPGMMLRIKHTTHSVRAKVIDVGFKVDINDISTSQPSVELGLNEIGQLNLHTSEPLVFDEYEDSRTTGSFILIDETSNETVGAGMIGRPSFLK